MKPNTWNQNLLLKYMKMTRTLVLKCMNRQIVTESTDVFDNIMERIPEVGFYERVGFFLFTQKQLFSRTHRAKNVPV